MKETGAASAFLPARKLAAFLGRTPTPLFLYDEKSLVQTARTLFAYFAWEPGFLPLFPVRMNRNPAILRLLCSVGCGAVCQTAEELRLAAVCGFSGSRLRYLPALPDAEAEQLAQELSECAEVSAALDRRMQDIRNHLAAVTEAQTNTKKREPLRLTGPLGLHAIRQKNDF